MILGVGTDLIEIHRIQAVYQRYPQRFQEYILHPDEITTLKSLPDSRQMEFLAGRFAGKEAYMKALGTGVRGIFFNSIAIINDLKGKPSIYVEGADNLHNIHISITHNQQLALAYVVIERINPED